MITRSIPQAAKYCQISPRPHLIPPAPPPAPTRSIEVLSITPGPAPGIEALIDLRVGGVIMRQVRVTNKGRGMFINYPARLVDGKWIELVEIVSPGLRAAIEDAILLALRGAK